MLRSLFFLLVLSGIRSVSALEAVKTDLWENGTGGFANYRIPGIVVTAKGTALAYCEARNGNDWGDIRIHLRRSADGGKTWDETRRMAEIPPPIPRNPVLKEKAALPIVTYNNPVAIPDSDGTVHFLFCVEYMRCFYQRSSDDGLTWSTPVEITESAFAAFRPAFDWKVLATGPGHGIQLRSGRLIVPVWLSKGSGGSHHGDSVSASIYSDDHGKTWHAGTLLAQNTPETRDLNETAAVERLDGSVLFNVRNHHPVRRRLHSISRDGATAWSPPAPVEDLYEPICFGSLIRHSWHAGEKNGAILFSLPAPMDAADGSIAPGNSRDRKNLTIRVSRDDGTTWPERHILEPGPSAYSDLAMLPDGSTLCLYERTLPAAEPSAKGRGVITLAKFSILP